MSFVAPRRFVQIMRVLEEIRQSNVPSRELRMTAFGMVLAVAYSISDNVLSNPPSVVRIGADKRRVAG